MLITIITSKASRQMKVFSSKSTSLDVTNASNYDELNRLATDNYVPRPLLEWNNLSLFDCYKTTQRLVGTMSRFHSLNWLVSFVGIIHSRKNQPSLHRSFLCKLFLFAFICCCSYVPVSNHSVVNPLSFWVRI